MGHTFRSRRPRGEPQLPPRITDPDLLAARLEDAAHYPGGHTPALYAPRSEAEIAAVLREPGTILPVGAQSSLTGGATPLGDRLLSTDRLDRVGEVGTDRVRVQAGVSLASLDAALRDAGRLYPPAPTFDGAYIGGTIATNAAGAATFKYGTTREWVEGLTVVLASGDVLEIERGQIHADADGWFEIELPRRVIRVHVPPIDMPDVPKLSAGYFARPGMDLIDLFIGSEGTLGVIAEARLRVIARRRVLVALIVCESEDQALAVTAELRRNAALAWRGNGVLDVSAVEY